MATPWTYFLRLSLSSVFLIDCFTGSPVHVLMSSIQAVRGLPRLRAPGIVRCSVRCGRYVRGRCSDTCRMFCWQCYAVPTTAPCSTSTPLTLIVPPSTGILCVAVVTLTLASDAETGCGRAAGSHVVCSRARHSSVTVNKCLTNQTYNVDTLVTIVCTCVCTLYTFYNCRYRRIGHKRANV